jgi:transglutaminase-like putative cysteine protease
MPIRSHLQTGQVDPSLFLAVDDVVQATHPAVVSLARKLRASAESDEDFARRAYEWVRDEIRHSVDAQDRRVTLTASEVLERRVGLCFAKSHLYAAILRSQGVPAALCYQRLENGNGGHVLHGLVAVYLRRGWHRQDVRGNNAGVDAQWSLDHERLAWEADPTRGEADYPHLFVAPASCVVDALSSTDDAFELCAEGLPSAL